MSIQNWGAIGELVGGAAVLVTLVYLALQIRQTQRFMRAQAYQDRSASLVDMEMRMAESEPLSAISLKLKTAGSRKGAPVQEFLTPLEQEQFYHWLFAHQHRFNNLVHQHEQGLLTDEYYETGMKNGVRFFWPQWKEFGVPIQGEGLNALVRQVDTEPSREQSDLAVQ